MELGFRPMARSDFPLVDRWLSTPHVSAWWREGALGIPAESVFGGCVDGDDPTEVFLVERHGRAIGIVQRYLLADYPAWEDAVGIDEAAGIDYLIGEPELTGLSIGVRMIELFTASTFDRYPGVGAVAVDVQQANRPSWRALEKAGFHRVFAGTIDADDPSDAGPAYVYVRRR